MKWTINRRGWGQKLLGAAIMAVPVLVVLWVTMGNRPVTNDPILLDYISDPVYAQATNTHTPTNTATNTATNTSTHTPTSTPSTTPSFTPDNQLYVDQYEPNNTLIEATTAHVNGAPLCDSTFWPVGDIDHFRFYTKIGSTYRLKASVDENNSNVDPFMRAANPNGQFFAQNDDVSVTQRDAEIEFTATVEGYYFAEVTNLSQANPVNQRYCFEVDEIDPPNTATPIPTATRVGALDSCEPNGNFEQACLIGPGQLITNLNFVPDEPNAQDNDYFRMWIRAGLYYTCGTENLSAVNDTNLIVYDSNGNGIGGNDDRDLPNNDLGSEFNWLSNYDGWVYLLVGPKVPVPYNDSPDFRYDFFCEQNAPTATPTATATIAFVPQATNQSSGPTATPFVFPTPFPTSTPFDISGIAPQPSATVPVVQILPLPTSTPVRQAAQQLALNVTVYYDANQNFMAELTEGVMEVAVALYDASTGQLLAFGYTNDSGIVRFAGIMVTGPVRVSVPFLNYVQTVAPGQSDVRLRIAPRPLPNIIP